MRYTEISRSIIAREIQAYTTKLCPGKTVAIDLLSVFDEMLPM